ncbi:MAG: ATP-binding protein [Desulfosalsimonadaceae bacterium]
MDQISTTKSNKLFEVTVNKFSNSGVTVLCPNGSEGWLPADEWSYESKEWERAKSTSRKGEKIQVIAWGKSLQESQIAVSRRRVGHNPWNNVTNEWIDQVKYFVVTRLTRRYAIGEIEPGLEASLELKIFDRYINEELKGNKHWRSHSWIALGDWVGGIVSSIDFPDKSDEPRIKINPYELFKRIEEHPEDVADQEQLAPPPDRETVLPPSDIWDRAPNVEHIFLVDNETSFLKAISDALKNSGYIVTQASTEEKAIQTLTDIEKDSIHVALIDLHLHNNAVHDGLEVARQINQIHPNCRIILMSGEDLNQDSGRNSKLSDGNGLKIASYLQKPLTIAQLQQEITHAATVKIQNLEDILEPLIHPSNTEPPLEKFGKKEDIEKRDPIQEAVDELGSHLAGVVAHVFTMHPLKKWGKSIAKFGDGLDLNLIQYKLKKSPVRDTAIDPARKFWVDHNVDSSEHLIGKHLWLRKAMNYRSSLGVPIQTTSPMGHCLLAFHPDPDKFNPEFQARAQLCAEKIGKTIEWKRLIKQNEEQFLLQTAGMAFVFLSHELRGILMGLSADAWNLKDAMEKATEEHVLPANLAERSARLDTGISRAIAISNTFRGVQSCHSISIDILECLDEAIQAAKQQIAQEQEEKPKATIDIRRTQDGIGKHNVQGDRSSLFIALFNLLLNAVQQIALFRRQKGLVWVKCSAVKKEGTDWIRMDVNDTGPGIHPSDFERVFAPGYSTKPPEKQGMGMGLHICRKVITNITEGGRRGNVEITKSTLCIGTTFSIFLPILKKS